MAGASYANDESAVGEYESSSCGGNAECGGDEGDWGRNLRGAGTGATGAALG